MYKNLLIVAAGGALGSIARFLIYVIFPKNNFPVNTLIINIAGSFVIGLLYAISLRQNNISETTLLFWATGICGGFTTFSTFSLENIQLLQSGKVFPAILYTIISITGGLLACWLGYKLLQIK
jgi:CrcB protein